ncbi:S8 family serine peptidase [Nonomuraea sp. NPDC046802]|uniref:S8 family serine peptidase n=1 Tax=Nonomuraea sp. NPDC046802 TaxID=3154919 RepID=UPI0033F8494A
MAALLAGTVGFVPAPAQAETKQPDGVTLITGDRVVVAGGGHHVEPGPGRQVGFTSQMRGGHLYVIPSDAQPLISRNVLDPRLFDVTQLLAWKYGDADRPDIPVIAQGFGGPEGAQGVRKLSGLGMSAARVPKKDAAQTWQNLTNGTRTLGAGEAKLWLDGRRSFTLDESVKQIGAPQAWEQGFKGQGVTVAVLDSGYDPDHPDLKDAVAVERNFSDDPDIRDDLGHGTHVASTVAGRGEKYRGVAPEARLAIGKVGGPAGPTDSAILAGMEWAATEVKAKVVNMSFGSPDGPDLDPVEQAVNTLSDKTGTLFVAAAGNRGTDGSVGSPGSAEAALTVGAVDRQSRPAFFSSRGPRVADHAIKPDVTAPGVDIVAAAASGTADGPYVAMSGTSMASPHVAGAAAILAQRHPDWTGAQLKAALIGSAAPAPETSFYQQGAGLVDLKRVLAQQVTADQANLWAAFPWDGDERVATKTITYANAGETPVSLDLSADGEVLKLSAAKAKVELPAKGQASVTLTLDASGKAPGDYPGTVTAKSGETVVRTLAGVYVEPESYDVTITAIDKQGNPVDPLTSQIYDAKTGAFHEPAFRNGVATIRLPKGDWNVHTSIVERLDGKVVETVGDSPLRVDGGGRRFTVDARQGKPARVTLDDPSATPNRSYMFALGHGAWNLIVGTGGDPNGKHFVIPARNPGLTYALATTWVSKDINPSPYVYNLVDRRTDGLPEDPSYDARQQDLAKIITTYRASGVAAKGMPMAGFRLTDFPGGSLDIPVGEISLPGTLVHYRTPGLSYESGLMVGTSLTFDGGKVANRGSTSEVWGAAVTGPSFLLPGGDRTGDKLTFSAAGLFADGQKGRTGLDSAATGTASIAKDGRTLAVAGLGCELFTTDGCELRADLPAGSGTYTLSASMRRQVPYSALSTSVESVWTFPSATTENKQSLPLMAVRYRPAGLDTSNRARPGSTTVLPISVERNPGAAPARAKSPRLEMSADDGATWRAVPVVRTGSGWSAVLRNPSEAGFVSLRAAVTDSAGAAVTQTVIRAYAIG